MIKAQKLRRQPFQDGLAKIYALENAAENAEYPDPQPTLKHSLRYDERTVGIKRYSEALQHNAEVKYLLRMPLRRDVSTQDIVVPNDGEQYAIHQVQYIEDSAPPVMDLTLVDAKQRYELG